MSTTPTHNKQTSKTSKASEEKEPGTTRRRKSSKPTEKQASEKETDTVLTIGVSASVRRKAQQHADALSESSSSKLTLKEYTEQALYYFAKYRIDPREASQSEDLAKEVHRLRNHLFGFLQTQERQYTIPLIKEVYGLQETTREHSKDISQLLESLDQVSQSMRHICLLLYKVKTIQDLSLTTLYEVFEDEKLVKGIVERNRNRFKQEMTHIEQGLEELFGK